MDLLPNLQNAVTPLEKLEDYVLNANHPTGQHKARVFKACLGLERHHAGALAEIIQSGLKNAPAERGQSTEHGDLWTTWHEIVGLNAQSVVITAAWMFKKTAPDIPRLISCYIETDEQEKLKELVASRRRISS